jgi:hypothetical protein
MAYTVSYAFILISVITTLALADIVVIYKLFFNLDMPEWTVIFRYIFSLMPSFHFTKLYGDLARVTCRHMITEHLIWVEGRPFETEDFFREASGSFATKDRYLAPPMLSTFKNLYCLIAFYMVIAWYFDNVLESNRGHS